MKLGIISLILVGMATTAHAQYAVQQIKDIAYAGNSNRQQTMTICKPVNAPKPMPTYVVIHGGGWYQGDKSETIMMNTCTRLAKKGYLVANINYRTVQGHDETAPIPNPALSNTFAAALLDAQLAVRFLRSQANRYGINSNKICSLGYSAGAHLAVFLGVLKSNYPGDVAGVLSSYSSAVNCVSAHFAPVDLTVAITGPMNDNGYAPIKSFINVAPIACNVDAYKAASPCYYPLAGSAPMHFTHGDSDTTVLPFQSLNMKEALQAAGVKSARIEYQGGHGFKGLTSTQMWSLIDKSAAWALLNAK